MQGYSGKVRGLSGGSEMFDPHLNPQLTSLPTGNGNLATGN